MSASDPNSVPQQHIPQPPYEQPPQYGQPRYGRNSLGTAAFVCAIIAAFITHLVSPLIMQALYRSAVSSYGPLTRIMFEWGPFIISLPLLLLAIGLGFAAVGPGRPARGKGLAYASIGAAGFGITGLVLSTFFSSFAYGFIY